MAKRRKKAAGAPKKRRKSRKASKGCTVKTVFIAPGVVLVAKSGGRGKRPQTFFTRTRSEANKLANKLRRNCK